MTLPLQHLVPSRTAADAEARAAGARIEHAARIALCGAVVEPVRRPSFFRRLAALIWRG
jgi:hypothetical protein